MCTDSSSRSFVLLNMCVNLLESRQWKLAVKITEIVRFVNIIIINTTLHRQLTDKFRNCQINVDRAKKSYSRTTANTCHDNRFQMFHKLIWLNKCCSPHRYIWPITILSIAKLLHQEEFISQIHGFYNNVFGFYIHSLVFKLCVCFS